MNKPKPTAYRLIVSENTFGVKCGDESYTLNFSPQEPAGMELFVGEIMTVSRVIALHFPKAWQVLLDELREKLSKFSDEAHIDLVSQFDMFLLSTRLINSQKEKEERK